MNTMLDHPASKYCALVLFAIFFLMAGGCSGNHSAADGPATLPSAPVVKVTRQNLSDTLEIASEFQPFQEIDVYAKVSGYIKKLYVDWGTHVQQGQLMAVLEIPELEQQIQHDEASFEEAQQELNQAQSAYQVAHVTYQRLIGVQKARPELISQEDIDVAQGKDLETDAAVSAAQQALLAAKAALEKDKTLYGYSRMTAPFDGVVTQMYAYTGALLPAGTSSNIGTSALCHLSQNDLLRLVIPVPERAVPDVKLGGKVAVTVSSLNRTFTGSVARISGQIDLATRTMHTEVQVPNPNYEIVPGMYATVEVPLHSVSDVLVVPVQAVLISGQDRGIVLAVGPDGRIVRREVTVGLQGASEVEITSGVQEGEMVIFGDLGAFKAGEQVDPKLIQMVKGE